MPVVKCDYCGETKVIRNYKKNYTYKRRSTNTGRYHYFCCYDCMRKAEKENPNFYAVKRTMV